MCYNPPLVCDKSLGVPAFVKLVYYFALLFPIYYKNYMKMFTHFPVMLLSSTDPENRKLDPGFKGLNATS